MYLLPAQVPVLMPGIIPKLYKYVGDASVAEVNETLHQSAAADWSYRPRAVGQK